MDGARRDFDRLRPNDVKLKENGTIVGTLPDGRAAIVRPESEPTLEVQRQDGTPEYKIRYR
jgi:hypothetical protein